MGTFEVPGDVNSGNASLKANRELIDERFKAERFRNPSLFIDGLPYHEPTYPDERFSED